MVQGFDTIEYSTCVLVVMALHLTEDFTDFDLLKFEEQGLARLGMPQVQLLAPLLMLLAPLRAPLLVMLLAPLLAPLVMMLLAPLLAPLVLMLLSPLVLMLLAPLLAPIGCVGRLGVLLELRR